eukprot:355170-Chlamydomonas_euryale.AAC.3
MQSSADASFYRRAGWRGQGGVAVSVASTSPACGFFQAPDLCDTAMLTARLGHVAAGAPGPTAPQTLIDPVFVPTVEEAMENTVMVIAIGRRA